MSILNTLIKLFDRVSLLVCVIVPTFCLLLLTLALGWSYYWIVAGIVLSLPVALTIFQQRYYQLALISNMLALIAIVVIASVDVWQSVFNDVSLKLPLYLLVLLLGLMLATTQQLLLLKFRPAVATAQINTLIAYALRAPSSILCLCMALILTDLVLTWLHNTEALQYIAIKFIERGVIPPITLTLFFWGLLLMSGKWMLISYELHIHKLEVSYFKLAYQRATKLDVKQDVLFSMLWQQFEAFYNLPRYLNWAIPILGFIGTVLGISLATEGLSQILSADQAEFSQLLAEALSPLAIAFDTTLVALSLSVILALLQTFFYRWEEQQLFIIEEDLRKQRQ